MAAGNNPRFTETAKLNVTDVTFAAVVVAIVAWAALLVGCIPA
jgi:hypothetical protein